MKDDTDPSEDNAVVIGTKKVFDLQVKLRRMTANLNSGSPNHYNVLFGLTTDPDDTPTDIPHTFAGSTLQTVLF